MSNYDAVPIWDQFVFNVAHGDDPIDAFNKVVRDATGTLGEDRWEDLRFPATGISIGGFTSAPASQTDTGLLLFDAAGIETVGILAQLPHAWKEGSDLKPHIHWAKTSDAAGDVVWTYRYKWIDYDGVASAWSSLFLGTDTNTVDSTQKHIITSFDAMDAADHNISALLLIQLARLGTDAGDTYAADALLYEFDIHYQVDGKGSYQEYIKAPA